jgi:AAA domain
MTGREPRLLFTSDRSTSLMSKDWLIRDVLAAGEISLILAPPFAGKSALAGDMSATVGTGEPWFGHQTSKAATLYVAQERSAVMYRRLRAYEHYHEVKSLPVALLMERLDLVNEAGSATQLIGNAVKGCQDRTGLTLKLIVLDTVAALSPGSDENSPRDMGKFVDTVCRVRDAVGGHCHISLVHHTPQDDHRRARGHSSLPGMVDVVILVSVKGKDRSWQILQANDLIAPPCSAHFELQSVTIGRDAEGIPTQAPIVVPTAANAPQADAPVQQKPLTPDGKAGLALAKSLVNGEPITVERFREAFKVHPSFKDRNDDARRRALKTVKDQLVATGDFTITGDIITVKI